MFDYYQESQSDLQAILTGANFIESDFHENAAEFIDLDYRLLITELIEIEKFVADVLKSERPGFKMNRKTIGRGATRRQREDLIMLPLANMYFRFVAGMFSALSLEYIYSPHVELFQESMIELNLQWEYLNRPRTISLSTGKEEYQLFNDLLERIREKAKSPEFRIKLKRLKELSIRNYKSAVRYINQLFKKFSKLMVLRVDFGYSKSCTLGISFEQAKRDLEHFFKNLNKNNELSEYLVGNIWKWEFAGKKGYHCHCLFFYNGQHVQKDENWGRRLGEYWNNVITPGRGGYWNVNVAEKKEEYRLKGLLGIGMIHRDDEAMRNNLLQHVAQYFFKLEQHIPARYLDNLRGRVFGKGGMKPPSAENAMGM